jgi:hypothetical protein
MTVAITRPLRTPACRVAVASGQLALPLRPPVVATCLPRPRRAQRGGIGPRRQARPHRQGNAVQLVIAFPAKPRRHRPVTPHAAANSLALQHLDIAKTVAGNISRRTERGLFRPYARTYANGEVYHYLRDKGFLIKVPASWRELYARGHKLLRLGTPPAELPARLGIAQERWGEIVLACSQRVVAIENLRDI